MADVPRKHWSNWPWSMIVKPCRRRVGHGVVLLQGPIRRFIPLRYRLPMLRRVRYLHMGQPGTG